MLFLIAQYILSLYDNKTPEYATILRITMGYFLSKSIYLDSSKNHFKKNPPLKDLNVYIDTTLLLYILNCKTEYQYNSAMSMVNLLLDNGASLFYYPHNLEEVEVIIKKYKNVRKLYVHVAVDTSLFVIGCFVSCCMQNRENFSWLALLLSICFTIPFFALNQITERRISNNDNTWL